MRWVVLLGLFACADLTPRVPGVCGNGVVDGTDDCDSTDRTQCTAQCRRVCSTASDCDAGWGCGTDRVCRHSTGRWHEVGAPILDIVEDIQLADLDGVGKLDVLGFGAADAFGHLVLPDGSFAGIGLVTPAAARVGAPAFGRLDDDAVPDLVVGGSKALAVFRGGSASTGFAPVQEPAIVVPAGGVALPLRAGPGAFDRLVIVTVVNGTAIAEVRSTDGSPAGPQVAVGPAQNRPTVSALDVDGDGRDEVIVQLPDGGGAATIFDVGTAGGAPVLVARAPLQIDHFTIGLLAVDVTGDGIRDIVAPGTVDGLIPAAVAIGDGLGGFGPVTPMPALDAAGQLFAVGDLDGDGALDLVGSAGVVLGTGVAIPASWGAAVIADINHDGVLDVVGIGIGLDLLLGGPDGFGHSRHLTDRRTQSELVVGDFDGDRFVDLAVRADVGAAGADTEVLILYGGPAGFTDAPQSLGVFQGVEFAAGSFASGKGPPDAATDLMVATGAQASAVTDIAFVIGAGDRVLSASVALAGDPETVLVGRFEGAAGGVVVLEAGRTAELVRGHGDTRLVAGDRVPLAIDPSVVQWCVRADFEAFPGALVADLDGDGRDEIVGLGCDVAHPEVQIARIVGPATAPVLTATTLGLAIAFRGLRTAKLVDVDRDGALDLVMTFDGIVPGPISEGGVVVAWGPLTGATVAETSVVGSALGVDHPGGVAVLEADGAPGLELALGPQPLGTDAVHASIVHIVDRALVPTDVSLPGLGLAMAAGDLDGDGVDDVVSGEIDGLHIYLGCSEDDDDIAACH